MVIPLLLFRIVADHVCPFCCIVISKLTNRHIVLRSMIKVVDNRPTLQEYTIDDVEANIQVIHRHDSAVSEPAMKRILRKPIDLSSELPARWVILKDAISFRLYLVGQHIAVDGQSMSIISKEFLDLLDNRDAKLGPVPDFGAMHMIEVCEPRASGVKEDEMLTLPKESMDRITIVSQ